MNFDITFLRPPFFIFLLIKILLINLENVINLLKFAQIFLDNSSKRTDSNESVANVNHPLQQESGKNNIDIRSSFRENDISTGDHNHDDGAESIL